MNSTVSRDTSRLTPDEQLAEALAQYYADPLGYVLFSFPWDTERSIQLVELPKKYSNRYHSQYGPDEWACDFLEELGQEIKLRGFDGRTAVDPIHFTTASGHGIGKSVMVGFLTKFVMDTRPHCKGVITANTAEQLRTKTWAEVGKWHKLSLTAHWFDYNTGRGAMSMAHKTHKETWRVDAQTCREENSEAFAGLHAANSTPFYIFDEASAVPDKIFEVREGGTTDGEPMIFDFGNPTRNSGRFFENTAGKYRKDCIVRAIDSRSVAITNKKRLAKWIETYGLESDFVKVRVRGMFPSAGNAQFVPTASVEKAQLREPVVDHKTQALVIGVDVARFGSNESVIFPRIGRDAKSFAAKRFRGLDTVQLTGKVIEEVRFFRALGKEAAAIFVDGGGIGGAVVDQLRHLGYPVVEVNFGGKPTDTDTYRFKGDEMWGKVRDELAAGLAIPGLQDKNGSELGTQLTAREYGYTLVGNKIHLETKEDMQDRLGDDASPDIADALALTYAEDIAPLQVPLGSRHNNAAKSDYDPLDAKF